MNFPATLSRTSFYAIVAGAFAAGAVSFGLSAFFGGYHVGQLAGTARVAKLERQYADASREANERARETEQALTKRANELAGALFTEKAQHALAANNLKRSIADVTTQYRTASDAPLQPLPRCVFTRGFVSVWNTALGATGVPASDPAAGTDASSGTAATVDAGIRQDDILANHIDNGQRCRDVESQLNRVLDWIEEGQK